MLALINSIFFLIFVISFTTYSFFKFSTRFSYMKDMVYSTLMSFVTSFVGTHLIYFLFCIFVFSNLLGNIPLNNIPTMFYSVTLTISLLFWLPITICSSWTDVTSFFAHLLPHGAPVGLMLFLPLVELFSLLIRPLTLMIRLSTNLAAGHIMMFMFSFFASLFVNVAPSAYLLLCILLVLEFAISLLQAYIFVSLMALYVNDSL